MEEKYLPIGTVCLLKGGKKRVMIIGFGIRPDENPDIMYDYLGCLFPEGVISLKQNMVFNHDQIQTIIAKGFADEETIKFNTELKNAIAKLNIKQAPSQVPQSAPAVPNQNVAQPQAPEMSAQPVQPAPIADQALAQTTNVAGTNPAIPTLEFEDV